MEIVAWAGILAGVVLYLAWPLVRSERPRSPQPQDGIELLARKEEAYADLADLELDYRMGKISEADYRELKEKYRFEALSLLGRMDEKEGLGEHLEREIKARRAALSLVFVLLLIPALAAAAVLEGRLSNKTPKGGKVGDVEVTLSYSRDGKEAKRSAKTDAKGLFRFADLGPGERYRVDVSYAGAQYSAEAEFDKAQERLKIEIPVYDSTDDASSLRVKAQHLVVNPAEGALVVEELLQFENRGNRTFIGSRPADPGRRATIELTLPEGAAEVHYGDGLMEHCVVAAPGGFVDTMDVKPGVREISFSYVVPANSDPYAFVRRVDYATDALNVFVGGGAKATSPGLETREVVQTKNGTYRYLAGKNLPRGASVTVGLADLPARTLSFRYVAFAAMALILAAALVYLLAGRRKRAAPAATQGPPESRYRELIDAVARLDAAFEAGALRPEEYERARSRKKQELLAFAEQMKEAALR